MNKYQIKFTFILKIEYRLRVAIVGSLHVCTSSRKEDKITEDTQLSPIEAFQIEQIEHSIC